MSIRDQAKLCFQKGKFVAAAEACACTRLPWALYPTFVSGPQSARSACARAKRRAHRFPTTDTMTLGLRGRHRGHYARARGRRPVPEPRALVKSMCVLAMISACEPTTLAHEARRLLRF